MENTVIIERYEKGGPAFISFKNDTELQPAIMASTVFKCYDEFMLMSEMRTGKKFYIAEPNGHLRITDKTVFK